MDTTKLLETIKKGVEFAEELTPVLSLIPGAGAILATATKAVGAVMEVVENVQGKVQEGAVVLTSQDQAELDGYIRRLTQANDELMRYVDES